MFCNLFCLFKGGSRSSHCEDSGRSGARHGSHAPVPIDCPPSVTQTNRSRRPPQDRMDIVPNNVVPAIPVDDVIASSK